MTPEQAKAIAALICRTIDYFLNPSDDKEKSIAVALTAIKDIPG